MNFNKIKIKIKSNKKTKRIYGIAKLVMKGILDILEKVLGFFFRVFPIDNKKIVIVNYNGKGYGDNPKYIVEEIIKTNKDYKIIWLVSKKNLNSNYFPKNIKLVKNETIKALFELSTAKVWIDNTVKRFKPAKRKMQVYIQTWHAGLGMKKVGIEATNCDRAYIQMTKKDVEITDYIVSNSEYRNNSYRNSFKYNCKILNYGLPRNDILVNGSDKIKHIKKSLNIVDEKILLYAPTFRRDSTTELFNADLIHVKEKLEKITKFKWKVLLRLHPFISDFSNDVLKDKSVIDVTNYMDLSELLLITDYLISDYSSLMFDYAITFKPVQIYAPDFDKYISNDGITLEKDEIPFFISRDNKELLNNIEKFDEEYYIKTLKEFFKNQGLNETGKASEKIVELIDDITEEGK